MDSTPAVASAYTTKPVGYTSWLYRMGILAFGGLLLGALMAFVAMRLPANRIVVFNQAYSTYLHVASVRIAKPGFLVLYLDYEGLQDGAPYFLNAGFHRDLTIPLNIDIITMYAPKPLQFVLRLYSDDGDGIFDERLDTPVKDSQGKILSKLFYMEVGKATDRSFRNDWAEPFQYFFDLFFP